MARGLDKEQEDSVHNAHGTLARPHRHHTDITHTAQRASAMDVNASMGGLATDRDFASGLETLLEARGGVDVQSFMILGYRAKDKSNHLVSGCARTTDRDLESGTSSESDGVGVVTVILNLV